MTVQILSTRGALPVHRSSQQDITDMFVVVDGPGHRRATRPVDSTRIPVWRTVIRPFR